MLRQIAVFALCLIGFGVVNAQDGPPPPPPPEIDGDVVVEGLNGPQGVFVDSEGNLWITESGLGGEGEIEFFNVQSYDVIPGSVGNSARVIRLAPDGTQDVVAEMVSVATEADIVGGGRITELDGDLYLTHGIWIEFLGEESPAFYGSIARLNDGEPEEVASSWAHELANNPDELDLRETHPYGITAGPDGRLYYADSAANSLIAVDPETGETETITAFDPVPGAFPSEFYGGELLAQAVPTAVAFDEDGTLYVSYLSGAPFLPGNARVVTVSEDGEVSDFANGLTMLTDLTYAPDGNLYATQFALFTQQGPQPNSGSVVRIFPDGTSELVVGGLPAVTAISFDADGGAYVAINGQVIFGPEAGAIVYYDDMTEREGSPIELPGPPPAPGS